MPAERRRAPKRGQLRSWRNKLSLKGAIVAGDTRLSTICYAYRFPSRPDRIKIGYSSRGLQRVADQSTAFPEMPELIFVIHDRDAAEIERTFHRTFAKLQSDVMGTEWFDVSRRQILAVSPKLRRAAGLGRARRLIGIAAASVVLGLATLAWPIALAIVVALSNGTPLMAAEFFASYAGAALDMDLGNLASHMDAALLAAAMLEHTSARIALSAAYLPVLAWLLFRPSKSTL